MSRLNPQDFIITRKRKKYKFALFHNSPLCFEMEEWKNASVPDVLEMGAGTGLFGVRQASGEPGKTYLAVDVKADRLQAGAYEAEAKNIKNIRFLRARADQLPELLLPRSLEKVWVTFPDPFPKPRAAKHRLTHPHYLELYAGLLKDGGALYFKTDAKALFEWSLERLVMEGWKLEELSFDLHESALPASYKIMTTYETRFTGEGLQIYFVKATPPRKR